MSGIGRPEEATPLSFRRVLNFRLVETSLDAADTSVCATIKDLPHHGRRRPSVTGEVAAERLELQGRLPGQGQSEEQELRRVVRLALPDFRR